MAAKVKYPCRLFYDEPGGEYVRTEMRELPDDAHCDACMEPLPADNPTCPWTLDGEHDWIVEIPRPQPKLKLIR